MSRDPEALATAWLAARTAHLAELHPLVRAEIEADVRFKWRWAVETGKPDIIWFPEGHPASSLATAVYAVLGRLGQAKYGKAAVRDREELRRRHAEVAAEAGMTPDGRLLRRREAA